MYSQIKKTNYGDKKSGFHYGNRDWRKLVAGHRFELWTCGL